MGPDHTCGGRPAELAGVGGRTTYPRELEDLLRPHPAVHDACNVAVPTATLGERVCACLVAPEGYTMPDLVCFCDASSLPASGKVKRLELARVVGLELSTTT